MVWQQREDLSQVFECHWCDLAPGKANVKQGCQKYQRIESGKHLTPLNSARQDLVGILQTILHLKTKMQSSKDKHGEEFLGWSGEWKTYFIKGASTNSSFSAWRNKGGDMTTSKIHWGRRQHIVAMKELLDKKEEHN